MTLYLAFETAQDAGPWPKVFRGERRRVVRLGLRRILLVQLVLLQALLCGETLGCERRELRELGDRMCLRNTRSDRRRRHLFLLFGLVRLDQVVTLCKEVDLLTRLRLHLLDLEDVLIAVLFVLHCLGLIYYLQLVIDDPFFLVRPLLLARAAMVDLLLCDASFSRSGGLLVVLPAEAECTIASIVAVVYQERLPLDLLVLHERLEVACFDNIFAIYCQLLRLSIIILLGRSVTVL